MFNFQNTQLANTIQADIGQMPSSRYKHRPDAGSRPRAIIFCTMGQCTSASHQQTQQPSIGPMMGRCLAFFNRPNAGSTSACHRHQPSTGPMMGSCPFLHHWPDAGSTSANSSAQYQPDDGLMPCFASIGPLLDLHLQLNSAASAQS